MPCSYEMYDPIKTLNCVIYAEKANFYRICGVLGETHDISRNISRRAYARRTFRNLSPSNEERGGPARIRNFTGDNDDVEWFVVPKVSVAGAAAFVAIVNNGRTWNIRRSRRRTSDTHCAYTVEKPVKIPTSNYYT